MDKQLENHQNKCRCCFKQLKSAQKTVEISKRIEQRFMKLTNISLVIADCYSSVICESCNSKLSEFSDFQSDLIENQTRLYNFVALEAYAEDEQQILEDLAPEQQFINTEQADIKPLKIEPPEIEDIIEYQIEALDESLLQAVHTQPQFKLKSVNFVDEEQDSNQEWPCNLCGCVFITRNLLKSHMKEHKGTRKGGLIRRMCQLCGLSFATNGWYHHMLRAHTPNVRFICDFCGKGFRVKHDLKDHIQTHMSVESRKKYPCSHCDSSLLSKAALKNHEMILHSEVLEEHPCECGKVFGSKMKLYQHRITVHLKGHFPCEQCDKFYTVKAALQKHIVKTHKMKVPCEVCGKMVAPGMFMNKHMKVHGPPGYKCTVRACDKVFHSRSALTYHNESQHEQCVTVNCPTCNTSYTSVRNLKRHIARQHSNVRVQCEVAGCLHTAGRKDYLASHYRSHRDIDETTRELLLAKVKDIKVISW